MRASSFHDPDALYGVITLNYDLVLENLAAYIAETFGPSDLLAFEPKGVPLAKLHGSADTGIIVAPTWNKTLGRNLLPAWKTAFELLATANQIRIIGYSLPTTDAYIKYLLRAAAIESPHLKKIDVLCRDDRTNSVYARYADFIDFANFRFVNGDIREYLGVINSRRIESEGKGVQSIEFRGLEMAHEHYFNLNL